MRKTHQQNRAPQKNPHLHRIVSCTNRTTFPSRYSMSPIRPNGCRRISSTFCLRRGTGFRSNHSAINAVYQSAAIIQMSELINSLTKASARAFSASRLCCRIFCASTGLDAGLRGGLSLPLLNRNNPVPPLFGLVSRDVSLDPEQTNNFKPYYTTFLRFKFKTLANRHEMTCYQNLDVGVVTFAMMSLCACLYAQHLAGKQNTE